MANQRLADRYSKSLIDLAQEQGILEQVHADARAIIALCKSSREFSVMLKSPVIKGDKKIDILKAVTQGKLQKLTQLFLDLLVRKNRESALQEIMQVFCDKYDFIKGISRINLTTAAPVSDDIKAMISQKLQTESKLTNIQLNTKVDESLIGGFVLEFNDYLLDKSVKKYLKEIKALYRKNEYVYNIR